MNRFKKEHPNEVRPQHIMERLFARGKRYGYDRARLRGLWRMSIQEYLTCAVQNIQVLQRRGGRPAKDPAVIARILEPGLSRVCFLFSNVLRRSRLAYIEQPVTCPA